MESRQFGKLLLLPRQITWYKKWLNFWSSSIPTWLSILFQESLNLKTPTSTFALKVYLSSNKQSWTDSNNQRISLKKLKSPSWPIHQSQKPSQWEFNLLRKAKFSSIWLLSRNLFSTLRDLEQEASEVIMEYSRERTLTAFKLLTQLRMALDMRLNLTSVSSQIPRFLS
jgi:hypothetical protein